MTSEIQVVSNVDEVTVVCFKDVALAIRENRFGEVEKELWALVDQKKSTSIILDFENKELPTCHVVQCLLLKLHNRLNGNLRLCNLPPLVLWHFEFNGLSDRLNLYATRGDALTGTDS